MDKTFKLDLKRLSFDLSIIVLASVIIVLPIFIYGIPNSADSSQHYQFAATFFDSIQNGNFYPGWAADSNQGFGDVGIRFYPPFAYYVMAGFRYLCGNWYDASVVTFIFWFSISGTGLYFWCREWFDETASLAGALLYILMPYHVNQIYSSFYAEFAGSAILPFCFLFITRVCRRSRLTDVLGLGTFYALLVLAHLPLAIIGSLSFLIYALASLKKDDFPSVLLKLSSAVFLGLAAGSFYWVKVVSELDWVRHSSPEFTSEAFDFHSHFLFSFLYTLIFQNRFQTVFLDRVLLLSIGVIVSSAAIFYVWSKEKHNQKFTAILAVLAFALFIVTPFSNVVWENFSILQKIQFPWRWLTIISLLGAFFFAACFRTLIEMFHTKMRPAVFLTWGLIFAAVIFSFTRTFGVIQLPREEFAQQISNIPTARSCECWWSVWSKKEALNNLQKVSVNDRFAQVINWQPTEKEISFASGVSANVRFAVFYYPHWRATINNQPTAFEISDDGTLLMPLPPEAADVKIWFQEPPFVRSSFYVSIFVWLMLAVVILSLQFAKFAGFSNPKVT